MHSDVANYRCAVCGATSRVEITRLCDPIPEPPPRAMVVKQLGATQEPTILSLEAADRLLFATCPKCGARNPEGVEHQRKEARGSKILNTALLIGLALGAWFVRWIAVALLALDVVSKPRLVALARKAGKPVSWPRLAANVLIDVALTALAIQVPSTAPLVPLLALVIVLRGSSVYEAPWHEAAESIRAL